MALYFTGWQHAGENLADVLRRRAAELDPPIQMCDALSRNLSPEFETLLAHCLSHGRREFVSLAENFPAECRHVLEALGEVYRVDAQAKEQGAERRSNGSPITRPTASRSWNSSRPGCSNNSTTSSSSPTPAWARPSATCSATGSRLTLFLRQAGAPLDNNIVRAGLEDGHPAPQEQPQLQDRSTARGPATCS